MVAALHQLRRSGTPFIWTSFLQKAFDCTLSQLAKPALLLTYILTEEATVTTDASETTIAGVLTQRGKPLMLRLTRAHLGGAAITVILSVKAWQLYGHCCACATCSLAGSSLSYTVLKHLLFLYLVTFHCQKWQLLSWCDGPLVLLQFRLCH